MIVTRQLSKFSRGCAGFNGFNFWHRMSDGSKSIFIFSYLHAVNEDVWGKVGVRKVGVLVKLKINLNWLSINGEFRHVIKFHWFAIFLSKLKSRRNHTRGTCGNNLVDIWTLREKDEGWGLWGWACKTACWQLNGPQSGELGDLWRIERWHLAPKRVYSVSRESCVV